MLKSSSGALTIVGLNTPNPSVFWKGFQLTFIKRINVRAKIGTATDLEMRVADPALQVGLTTEEKDKLIQIYNEMRDSDIEIEYKGEKQ